MEKQATWPTPSSRLHKIDLLESIYDLAEEDSGHAYTIESHGFKRKAVRPVKPL